MIEELTVDLQLQIMVKYVIQRMKAIQIGESVDVLEIVRKIIHLRHIVEMEYYKVMKIVIQGTEIFEIDVIVIVN
jgi:hypothetical protein